MASREFLEIYEKYKVSDTCSILRGNVKDFLNEMEDYYVRLRKIEMTEDDCKCGHAKSIHTTDVGNCKYCKCEKFTAKTGDSK